MKYTLLLVVSTLCISAYAMEELEQSKERNLVVRNEVGEKVKLTYVLVDGKTIESVVADKESLDIPLEDDIETFIIRPHGKVKSMISREKAAEQLGIDITPRDYAEEIKDVLKKAQSDDQYVLVEISQGKVPKKGLVGTAVAAISTFIPALITEFFEKYGLPYKVEVSVETLKKDNKSSLIPERSISSKPDRFFPALALKPVRFSVDVWFTNFMKSCSSMPS